MYSSLLVNVSVSLIVSEVLPHMTLDVWSGEWVWWVGEWVYWVGAVGGCVGWVCGEYWILVEFKLLSNYLYCIVGVWGGCSGWLYKAL